MNLNLKDMLESRLPTADKGLLHKIGIRRNIRSFTLRS